MAILTLKLSPTEAQKLSRSAAASKQTKSAYIRRLIAGRIETTDDLLLAWERGEVPKLRRSRRRRTAA